MDQHPTPTVGPHWAINAQDGSHVDTVSAIALGVAFLWLLLAYMRLQGRYRKFVEKQFEQERAAR